MQSRANRPRCYFIPAKRINHRTISNGGEGFTIDRESVPELPYDMTVLQIPQRCGPITVNQQQVAVAVKLHAPDRQRMRTEHHRVLYSSRVPQLDDRSRPLGVCQCRRKPAAVAASRQPFNVCRGGTAYVVPTRYRLVKGQALQYREVSQRDNQYLPILVWSVSLERSLGGDGYPGIVQASYRAYLSLSVCAQHA